MHLMRLLDGKMIALFGPTRASEKMLASERRIILESASPLSCQPCYDGKNYVACRENICLSRISPATIFKMLQANFDLKS
jgi:heptosyltransferase-2